MRLERLLPASKAEQACIWEIFRVEDRLWDIESELLEDQRYYESRLRSTGTPETITEWVLSDLYRTHLQQIRALLDRLPQSVRAG